ncbi:ABC transporter ATP-binding protein [Nocardioides sp. YJ-D4]|uniref:Branched-chain amino acid transport system ATP-binding protein n=1 Tax=Nocardioides panzhihuensis TaxID=860243 RepID=A0A7Z0DN30_9ACTN|nr:branched-chain amino acid transport system ATP-binding protein [Nocardioides panzhihuensis]
MTRRTTMATPSERPIAAEAGELVVSNLEVVYNDAVLVLRGISVSVPTGSVVALLGANGAGKTTLLRAISGLLDFHRGDITKGSVGFAGADVTSLSPSHRVTRGLAQVMEGRRIFQSLSVEENLRAGAIGAKGTTASETFDRLLDMFPVLAKRRRDIAGYLSGGEQQMLAIGRALMSGPTLLLLDEPSLGLAPRVVEQIRDAIVSINGQGTSVLLVEQNATMALSIANHAYVLEHGRIVSEGSAAALMSDRNVADFYLGGGEHAERSYRDVKTYRRRKNWGT